MLQLSTDDHVRITHTDLSTFSWSNCWFSELLRAVFALRLPQVLPASWRHSILDLQERPEFLIYISFLLNHSTLMSFSDPKFTPTQRLTNLSFLQWPIHTQILPLASLVVTSSLSIAIASLRGWHVDAGNHRFLDAINIERKSNVTFQTHINRIILF